MFAAGRDARLPRLLKRKTDMQSSPRQDQRLVDSDGWQAAQAQSPHAEPIIQAPCASSIDAPRRNHRTHKAAGFTLIELMIATAVAGVLSSIAYPSFTGQMQKTRRADALISMMQVQMAEERFRANGARYGSLADIGSLNSSAAGNYAMQVLAADGDGYQVLATATGAQAGDAQCRNLLLRLASATVSYASGPDASVANPDGVNRRCWNL